MRTTKAPQPTGDEITVRQAIELSGLTRQGIYSILVNGRVAYKKWGNVYAIDRDSFLRYLRSPRRLQMRQQLPVE
jgi:hypothetical protein